MTDKIDYGFDYKERFFSVRKKYMLRLQQTDYGVQVSKIFKEIYLPQNKAKLDLSERFLGRMTAGGVFNQLANIRQIVFEVTDVCNLQCTYCVYGEFYDNYDKRENQYMNVHKAKILINFVVEKLRTSANLSQCKELTISFYGGEPLMNMDFVREIVAYTESIQNEYIIFKYTMTTNGVLLRKNLDFLISHHFSSILVSLDGSEKNDAHRKFHNGSSSFRIVYENLKYIQMHYPDFFDKVIFFNSVLHNLNNGSEVFWFFQREFGKIPLFSVVNDMGIISDLQEAFSVMAQPKEEKTEDDSVAEMHRVLDLQTGKNQRLQHFIFRYSGNIYRDYNDLFKKEDRINYFPTATCYPFSKKIFMTVTNKILVCERIGHEFALGRVTDIDVEIDCEEVARKCNSYYDSLRKQCVSCYQSGHCSRCMYTIKDLRKKPVCPDFGSKRGFEQYLQGNIQQLSEEPELYDRIMKETIIIE